MSTGLKVVIVGAGLGGLACAIACRQHGLEVTVLERTDEIRPVGAGIQLPSNASRVMRHLGVGGKLTQHGAVVVSNHTLRSYKTGRVLARKLAGQRMVQIHGSQWMVIHRAEYQILLLEEARRLGVVVRTSCDVVGVSQAGSVVLRTGEEIAGDAIIGADGLWSSVRTAVLGIESPPTETGDLAYRGTFTAEQLRAVAAGGSREVEELLEDSDVQVWLGPEQHAVFYPVNGKDEYNLVLLRPDDLPANVRIQEGSLEEMRETFRSWDPRLTQMIAQLKTALKWKLYHHAELDTWVRGSIALLGDASHPTLPYQAQGAAMAVEDGAVIGTLLGRLQESGALVDGADKQALVGEMLKLYERLRKTRTSINVQGAVSCQDFYHLPDGDEQVYRDDLLEQYSLHGDWPADCKWNWGDAQYQQSLLSFDAVDDARQQFDLWHDRLE